MRYLLISPVIRIHFVSRVIGRYLAIFLFTKDLKQAPFRRQSSFSNCMILECLVLVVVFGIGLRQRYRAFFRSSRRSSGCNSRIQACRRARVMLVRCTQSCRVKRMSLLPARIQNPSSGSNQHMPFAAHIAS